MLPAKLRIDSVLTRRRFLCLLIEKYFRCRTFSTELNINGRNIFLWLGLKMCLGLAFQRLTLTGEIISSDWNSSK